MNKKAQVEMFGMELNPMAIAAGLICGFIVMVMMGFTGKVQLGLFFKILGFVLGGILGYVVFNTIMNK